jgi:LCP family protein required for cell wall assembly
MGAWAGSARHRRDAGTTPVRWALLAAALSALLPGVGQWYAGRRRRAIPYLVFTALTIAVAGAALFTGRVRLLELAVQQSWLIAAVVGTSASLLVRAVSAVDAYACLRPLLAPPRPRAAGGLLALGGVVLVLALPHAVAVRDVMAQERLITSVFQDAAAAPVAPGPVPASDTPTATPSDSGSPTPSPTPTASVSAHPGLPGLGRDGRFTVLLLGSDAGPSRDGARTDSMIVLSIDPRTRSALMIGVPRNLDRIPFPPGPLQTQFPNGFSDIANAVYRYGSEHPSLFPAHTLDTGARAIEEAVASATGLEIDDWAMVDLSGVVGVVNALGGIEIDIPEHLADRVSPYKVGGPWISADIAPGRQHLTADQVYVYVRSRHADSDYQRMRRQRCVLEAMGDQLTGPSLVADFPSLAGAISQYVSTDIPRSRLPQLVRLGATLNTSRVRTLLLTPPLVNPLNPDYTQIRALVRAALAGHLPATNSGSSLAATCG